MPQQHQPGFFRDLRHRDCLQILLCRIMQESFFIFRGYDNRHSFLRFGNRQLRSVQSCVFLGYQIQIYGQSVCQLPDRDRNAACTEIIAFLNQAAYLRSAEESLNLPFRRCVSLLHLRTASSKRGGSMFFGRAGCPSNAVSSRAATQKDDHILRLRLLSHHVLLSGCAHDGTNFHALCHIARVINFIHQSGCKPDLIAIGGISVRRPFDQSLLRQLSLKRLRNGKRRIRSSRYPHCLIHITSSGKRIPDCSSKAGSSASKRLDLRRMVVRFILKKDQPVFSYNPFSIIHLYRNHYRTGIVLLGVFLIGEQSVRL